MAKFLIGQSKKIKIDFSYLFFKLPMEVEHLSVSDASFTEMQPESKIFFPKQSSSPFRFEGTEECEKNPDSLNGCRCCFTPDRMFENAVDLILALEIDGIDALRAQKFVRLCLADNQGTMQLSKKKR